MNLFLNKSVTITKINGLILEIKDEDHIYTYLTVVTEVFHYMNQYSYTKDHLENVLIDIKVIPNRECNYEVINTQMNIDNKELNFFKFSFLLDLLYLIELPVL